MAGSDSSAPDEALGLLETFGLVAAIEGADAMLKAARVRLVQQERTVPALITSTIVGETAAVQAAVDAGRAAAERVGKVVSAHVIPRPAADVWTEIMGMKEAKASPAKPTSKPASRARLRRAAAPVAKQAPSKKAATDDTYADLTVSELRRLARAREHPTFQGRVISRASKRDLLRFLRTGQP